jgi:TolA-binding protein
VNRPNLPGGGGGIGNRPNLPGGGIANRPNLPGGGGLNRPDAGLGVGGRPGVSNRPNIYDRPGISDRPGITTLPGNINNRPNFPGGGNNIVNRPGGGNNIVNRPGGGNNIVNRPGGNNNNININRPNINVNNPWNNRPGWGNHPWVNGYWHGANNNWWNNWGGFATGVAVGGLAGWGMGSSWWNWGYMPYVNPYVVQQPIVVQQPVIVDQTAPPVASLSSFDYSQPLDTTAPPPDDAAANPAMDQFDQARALFKQGDFAGALAATDAALKAMPNDAAIHEFRALCLFALGQYPQAAGVLYAVLSAGPGWDWTTLIGLYPSLDVYTTQLRALEDYARANPDDPASRFVLGYHYLTQGHTENAAKMFEKVVQLQPKDALSAALVQQLGGAASPPADGTAAAPAPAPAQPAAPAGPAPKLEDLKGAPWSASPAPGVTIGLALAEGDAFTWTVTQKGQAKPITGTYTYADGLLTLAQTGGAAMVGRLTAEGAGFRFQAVAAGGADPGLLFTR